MSQLTRPITNQLYRHYKGGLYRVIATALHTETNELLVVYKNFNDEVFARPLGMWNDNVTVCGNLRPRFDLLYSVNNDVCINSNKLLNDKLKL